jgi:hypothetical protein
MMGKREAGSKPNINKERGVNPVRSRLPKGTPG